jgi:hypothetical protein
MNSKRPGDDLFEQFDQIMTVQRKIANVERAIRLIRGQRVMLDSDLAVIYGVTTKRLNERLRRNRSRFPSDLAFRLTADQLTNLRSQIATSSFHGGAGIAPGFSLSMELLCSVRARRARRNGRPGGPSLP